MDPYKHYLLKSYRMDDEDEPKENNKEEKGPDSTMLMKKLEQYFFDKRAVYLWGVVEDKSAREVVTRMLLLDADKPGEEIKFFINSPGGVVTSGMVIYDTMKNAQEPRQHHLHGPGSLHGFYIAERRRKRQTVYLPAR